MRASGRGYAGAARGERVGHRYRLTAPLGSGGEGSCYRATDERSGREVAIKVAEGTDALASALTVAGRLVHPSLAAVLDFGRTADSAWIASELVEGETLDAVAAGARWPAIAEAIAGVLDALSALAERGLRHGDVTAKNIVVDERGRGVLVDLGMAGPLEAPLRGGTPGHVAPELALGARDDGRGDVYALGRTLEAILPTLGEPAPSEARELAARCVRDDRPSALEALAMLGVRRARGPSIPSALVGRETITARLDALMNDLAEGIESPRALALHGPRESGKSAVLARARWLAGARAEVVEIDDRGVLDAIARATGSEVRGFDVALDALGRWALGGGTLVFVADDLEPDRLLDALARALDPKGPIALLVAGEMALPSAARIELAPLDEAAFERWLGASLERPARLALARASGGWPGRAVAILRALGVAHPDAAAIEAAAAQLGRPIGELSPALVALALRGGRALPSELARIGADASQLARLAALGRITRERELVRLTAAPADVLAGARPAEVRAIAKALAAIAQECAEPARRIVERARLLARAGDREASALLLASPDAPWDRASAEAIAEAEPRPEVLLSCAAIEERTGRPDLALATLTRVLRGRPDPDTRNRARLAAASAYARNADSARALLALRRFDPERASPLERARAADLASRALVQKGRAVEARAVAEDALAALEPDIPARERSALAEDVGVAASYLGDHAAAKQAFARAEGADDPRSRVRLASYRAIDAHRAGDLDAARACYREALRVAEEHALDDQLASAALNLGTIEHARGDLGAARAAYDRASRLAAALRRGRTQVAALYDRAQLLYDAGQDASAALEAEAALAAARAEGFEGLAISCLELTGALALRRAITLVAPLRDGIDEAERAAAEARALAEEAGAERERIEVELLSCAIELAKGMVSTRPERALAAAEAIGARDLVARACSALALAALEGGEPERALSWAERALETLGAAGSRDQRAEAASIAARAAERAGAPGSARAFAEEARGLWERMALALPSGERAAFWSTPARRALGRPAAASSMREQLLERLLAINARLSSSLEPHQVVELAMEAAIDLSGAERGFVLLRDPRDGAKLRVAAARHVDRRVVDRAWLAWSRGIAEQVIASGEPIVSAEASEDARFRGNRSVHALGLRSVIGVPIRARRGVIGALYLDHRFARGSFAEGGVEALLAFSDQVAIALENARLVGDLAARTRELERERARIAALLDDREREVGRLSESLRALRGDGLIERFAAVGLVGRGAVFRAMLETLERVAPSGLTVLVSGESGTGKELVARALHHLGPSPTGPLVSVNCAALPPTLLESELFGHVRGAFTGAERDRSGLFVEANGGTLFLDEIGEIPLAMQAKLLRALQEREVRPLGGTKARAFEARIVAATNRDLRAEVSAQRFREDLYYRLAVVEVRVPPLRERLEDLPLLAERLLERAASRAGRPPPKLSREAQRALASRAWPGNVRELENVLAAAAVMADGDRIEARDLAPPSARPTAAPSRRGFDERERERVASALEAGGWNVTEVCRTLGIPRTTLYRKLRKWGLEPRRP